MATVEAVIGVGASAGGLDYLKEFVSRLPEDLSASVIVVQHLEPSYESRLAELLGREAAISVHQAENGEKLAPGTVYTIPSNAVVSVEKGTLKVEEPESAHLRRLPTDYLFTSLAREYGEQAVGIVLTGNGSDGTDGVRTIHEYHGLTIAQDPSEAPHEAMPRSAINSAAVDRVLPVAGMVETILGYLAHRDSFGLEPGDAEAEEADPLEAILDEIYRQTGYDFSKYKRATLQRRVARRIGLSRSEGVNAYRARMKEDEGEMRALLRDLLITVTRFFRDDAAFEALSRAVEELLSNWGEATPPGIRAWVPGCSTGEEAYSIAIVIGEIIESRGLNIDFQVFATDIESGVLETARQGEYGDYVASQMSEERLSRYFQKIENGYRVKGELRERVMFSEQNLLGDPPFSNLDLVSCRNLLIYLDRSVHDDILSVFHFALRGHGILFLGASETIGENKSLFAPFDRRSCVYRRQPSGSPKYPGFPIQPGNDKQSPSGPAVGRAPRGGENPEQLTRRVLAEEFGPAAIAVDKDNELRYVHGPATAYLEFPAGEPRYVLPQLLKPGLSSRVMNALRSVRAGANRVEEVLRFRDGDTWRTTRLVVSAAAGDSSLVVVAFASPPGVEEGATVDSATIRDQVIESLERELETTKSELRTRTEEMEASNEELKASNEEIMSMNEELQSTNEELETSKEETQSLNEELQTVNDELEDKIDQLQQTKQDIENLLESSDIATLFFDAQKRLRRYSQSAAYLFHLFPSDIGQTYSDLPGVLTRTLEDNEVNNALGGGNQYQREVRLGERWYYLRTLPYHETEDLITGVVVTLTDINRLKETERNLTHALDRYKSLSENSQDLIARFDDQLRLRFVNSRVAELFGGDAEEYLDKTPDEMVLPADLCGGVDEAVPEVLRSQESRRSTFSVQVPDGKNLHLDALFVPEPPADGSSGTVLLVARDITERVEARQSLEKALADREVLIQDVHHRVKNNLFMLVGLLQLERSKLEEILDDPQPVSDSIDTIIRRIQVMSRIYTYLYESTGEARIVHGDSFLTGLAVLIRKAYAEREVELTAKSEGLQIPVDTAIPLGLIINEAVTNSYKYAFPDGEAGTIELRLEAGEDGEGVLRVVDDGVGLDLVGDGSSMGLGMRLIDTLSRQVRGELSIDGQAGTSLELRFPLEDESV